MSPYKKAEALESQVCLASLYSCAVGVKSTAASLRLLSPEWWQTGRWNTTHPNRTNTLDWYILLNKLPKGQVENSALHPSLHAVTARKSKENRGFWGVLLQLTEDWCVTRSFNTKTLQLNPDKATWRCTAEVFVNTGKWLSGGLEFTIYFSGKS